MQRCMELSWLNIEIPKILPEDRTANEEKLLNVIDRILQITAKDRERLEAIEAELARLKRRPSKPKIRASKLENKRVEGSAGSRDRSANWSKKGKSFDNKKITRVSIPPVHLPDGLTRNGIRTWTVQELIVEVEIVRYERERWITPDGEELIGELPIEVQGSHFGPKLISYIISQSMKSRVSQNQLLEELQGFGVSISEGQVDEILRLWGGKLEEESSGVLRAGLEVANYSQVDDTGARHKKQNGYTTQIGGEFFCYFKSTDSKSRINFLEILQAGAKGYILNEPTFRYLREHGFSEAALNRLPHGKAFVTETWNEFLKTVLLGEGKKRTLTEAALFGSAVENGLREDMLLLSDDAGQFNILLHALCWVHAERPLLKLIAPTQENQQDLDNVLSKFWELYRELKEYKEAATVQQRELLEKKFDTLISTKTSFQSLNLCLAKLGQNKKELLVVLSHPVIPLHNNASEQDIRSAVIKRKISGGTRSDDGRIARDTFLSLVRTCKKLKLSFYNFILDRVSRSNLLPPLGELVRLRYLAQAP